MDKVMYILNLLYDEEVESEYCSPNLVAYFAGKHSIKLSSDDIVYVSDVYGTEDCPTGRYLEQEYIYG